MSIHPVSVIQVVKIKFQLEFESWIFCITMKALYPQGLRGDIAHVLIFHHDLFFNHFDI